MKLLLSILLYPFTLIYALITELRNWAFDVGLLKTERFGLPVIGIGNISVGGTGKTPHTEYLVNLLLSEGYRVAILSRGYRRESTGFFLAKKDSSSLLIGDEPRQIKLRFPEAIVAVDENRCRGIHKLLNLQTPPQVILLDDAFQHRYVQPSLNILIDNAQKPMEKDFLFPSGRLRERGKNRKRADMIIVSKCPETFSIEDQEKLAQKLRTQPEQTVFFSTYTYQTLQALFSENTISLSNLQQYEVMLLTGIASPSLIVDFLRHAGTKTTVYSFPDHHFFSENDLQEIGRQWNKITHKHKIIITTSKDASRLLDCSYLPSSLEQHIYVLALDLKFLNQEDLFCEIIMNHVRKN